MKKVIAVLGTRRKANTYGLLMQIGELLSGHGIELEVVELYKHDVRCCIGCEQCILKGSCVLTDEAGEIMDRLAGADGIILASPVYMQQVSGKMKDFIDRTCRWYHRPELTGKPVLCVATTKGSGLKATLKYMENVAAQWGAFTAGTVGRTIFRLDRPVGEKELSRFVRLLEEPESYSPTLKQLIGFEVQKSLALYLDGLDAVYWREKGWAERPYFYPCRVNKAKSLLSGFVGKTMRKRMGKSTPQHTAQ